MTAKIAYKFKMRCKTCVLQHAPSIAAYWEDAPCLHVVVFIQRVFVGMLWNRAFVNHGLPIVFASRFDLGNLEQALGGGIKIQVASALCQYGIGNH